MKIIKNYKASKWLNLLIFSFSIMACESMEETFSEFTVEGETIYIGTADTVLIGPGFEKLRFWVAINADPKISSGVLKTSDESIMHEFDVVRTQNGQDTVSFDLKLPEGEYTFGLFLMDDVGHQSVRREVPATVYGQRYQESLISRGIVSIDAFADSATFTWGDAAPNVVTTTLTYEDTDGNMQRVEVPNETSQMKVGNYKLGGEISVISDFAPSEYAIEIFESNPTEKVFPEEYLLDKSIITPLRLAGDAGDGCYGSSYDRLTDGSTSDFWHSCEDEANLQDQYPWVMSFDLGTSANLSRFRLDERADCCGERSPAAYQIWGANDLAMGPTVDIDSVSVEEWGIDAAAKGWVKLVDVSGNNQPTFEVEIPENGTTYQYLRLVGISSIGGGAAANFNELTFWGN
ncbi:MAG: DUF4998 domain-containing protein [Cyclobacteriaceae bacterium]